MWSGYIDPTISSANDISRWKRLNRKLRLTLLKLQKGDLGRQLSLLSDQLFSRENRTAVGRGLWYIITKYYASTDTGETYFSILDLQRV